MIQEIYDLGVHPIKTWINAVFNNIEEKELKNIEQIKEAYLTKECINNIKYMSKSYYNGTYDCYIVVLNNGEWFELQKTLWGGNSYIGNCSKDKNKDYFNKYLG